MAALSEPPVDRCASSGDAVDQALALAWTASDIAIDVFGLLFWGALALLVAGLTGIG